MPPKQDVLRKRVYKFYSDNIAAGKDFTRAHFIKEGVPETTLYRILRRFDNNLPAAHQSGGGRPAKIFTPNKLKALRRKFDHKDGISQRQAAKQFNCTQPMICKTLKKLKIDCRKKKTKSDGRE
ncbi:putative tripeptidyl-peptidase 2-like [Ditylenchus destructor]|uniref:Tripeptidyl-peptidase 2-like n=1 Tax=Ditylenchus destructor TaxID=166010 RepID=A0AAD4NA78_9BILA|nr:putative tripeptidyl-peptidase 2-like [Ditylenchus destructor]KAI1720758.1 putative tripeptidyl-peptidase 2-like [Ditylenchus destructor]